MKKLLIFFLVLLFFSCTKHTELIFSSGGMLGISPDCTPAELHVYGVPFVIEKYDDKEYKVIQNINDSRWKLYPDLKTKVVFNGKTLYLNYKQFWNDFLLCEPYPNQILNIKQ